MNTVAHPSRKRVVLLTGSEIRHEYFYRTLAARPEFDVVLAVCEGDEKSLLNRTRAADNASWLELQHAEARQQAEEDFFRAAMSSGTCPPLLQIAKGAVNEDAVTQRILDAEPDVLACYGSSLIKSEIVERFAGRFINVHLGLSPYYRGSGTNIFPIINDDLDLLGATFMHIDRGVDTGLIIHQMRAQLALGDSPHSIGNRIIRQMTATYGDILARFDDLTDEPQPEAEGLLYKMADFDAAACRALYDRLNAGIVENYLRKLTEGTATQRPVVTNRALAS